MGMVSRPWSRFCRTMSLFIRLFLGCCYSLSFKTVIASAAIAVGTLIAERPPHRTVQAAFPHTACMGLSLSRGRHANLVVLCIPFFCSTRAASTLPSRPHISTAVAAQRRARTALLQRRRRLVLDGREHGGRLPAIGWLAVR